ncbi:MAG: hypothetical protein CMJ44_16270 [Pimelobacter sp.]|nr:hypothetical protein [Pimelobacter sp.]
MLVWLISGQHVVGEVPFEARLVIVNEMLARLQELNCDQDARDPIGQVHHRIRSIFDPTEFSCLKPNDCRLDDDD